MDWIAHNPGLFRFAAVAVALFAGAVLWLGLWWRQRRQPLSERALITLLVGAGLLCRLTYVVLTPPFRAPDEQSHFNYVKFLVEQRAFPVATTKVSDGGNEYEYFQPPLYYLALTPGYALGERVFAEPGGQVRWLRGWSVLLWLGNVALVLTLLRRLRIDDPFTRVFVVGMVCLLPTYTFVSAALNNDNLLTTLGGVVLCLLARSELSWRAAWLLGAVLGAACLTKQTALALLPATALCRVLQWWPRREHRRIGALQLLATLALALALATPWALRNWHTYGTFTPENLSAAPLGWPSALHGLLSAAHNLLKTFWAVAGISNQIGYPFPLIGYGLVALWFIGWQENLQTAAAHPERPRPDPLQAKTNRAWYAATAVAVVLTTLLVLRFGFQFGMGQGRHLYLLLTPLALWLAAGLRGLPVPQLHIHAAGFWILYAAGFATYALAQSKA